MSRTLHAVALMIDRALADRAVDPTPAVIDSQTVEAPAPGAERGDDGAKRTVGCKRHIAVDTESRLSFVHLRRVSPHGRRGAFALASGQEF